MSRPLPYNYICIEGNIGTGKTSLCEMISRDYNCKMILEEFRDNPFLPFFYQDPERYAFTVELFFMTERHKEMQNMVLNQDLFADFTITDYSFWKTLIFARNNLTDQEYRLFQRLFTIMHSSVPDPDLLVYLHKSPKILLENIKTRNRSYEQNIDESYLQHIQDSYFEFFRSQLAYPILIVESEHLDFVRNDRHYEELLHLMSRSYQPGVHRVILRI